MMMDYFNEGESEAQAKFAAKRDQWFRPAVLILARVGLSPNAVSALGVIFAILAAFFQPSFWYGAAVLLLLYILMDGLDGPLARHTSRQSQGGSLVDIFSDQVGVVIVAVASVVWVDANLPLAIAFAFLYIHVIYMMVICNSNSIRLPKIARVKYIYFFVYTICLIFENSYAVEIFHTVFGLYYFYYFLVLAMKISAKL